MGKLIDEVKKMEDTRQQWKIKHNLVDILIIVMLSILTGHNDFEEMVIFAEARVEIYEFIMRYNSEEEFKNNIQNLYDNEISKLSILHIYALEEILRYGTKGVFNKFIE